MWEQKPVSLTSITSVMLCYAHLKREEPRGSDGVDCRYEYIVEFAIGCVHVLGNLVSPRYPLAALAIPEIIEQGRRSSRYFT